jgi:hypothetical protein
MTAGRPKAQLDEDRIKKLASIGLSVAEIAAVEGVNKKTIERRCLDVVENGRLNMNASLKRKQYDMAVNNGNVAMLIWLGKQYLGQRDKSDQNIDGGFNITIGEQDADTL